MLNGKFVKCKFHHTHSTFHNLFASRHHSGSLLAAEHSGGNLGSVGEIVEASLHHFDARHGETLIELVLELHVDFIAAGAESELILIELRGVASVIVGILPRHLAQRGIALDAHKLLQLVHARLSRSELGTLRIHLKHSLVGVFQFPHHHQANHDGVAHLVIHLDRLHIEVAGTQGELFS